MTPVIDYVRFPFEAGKTYPIGELRAFERLLLSVRQNNRALSAEWRVPSTPEMKRWCKLREETYPIKLLADHKAWSDDVTFYLKPVGYPNIDAEIKSAGESFELQITIADPIWGGNASQNGGYDHRLVMEALNKKGVVHGSALMRRVNGDIVSGKPVRSFEEEFAACEAGLANALVKKLRRSVQGCHLLIHARDYGKHTMDFSLEDVARSAIQASNVRGASGFAAYYVVDQKESLFFSPDTEE